LLSLQQQVDGVDDKIDGAAGARDVIVVVAGDSEPAMSVT